MSFDCPNQRPNCQQSPLGCLEAKKVSGARLDDHSSHVKSIRGKVCERQPVKRFGFSFESWFNDEIVFWFWSFHMTKHFLYERGRRCRDCPPKLCFGRNYRLQQWLHCSRGFYWRGPRAAKRLRSTNPMIRLDAQWPSGKRLTVENLEMGAPIEMFEPTDRW